MVPAAGVVARLLDAEALALLTRLDAVKPFALHETMVPAAGLFPPAQSAIEGFLLSGRRALRARVRAYLSWLRGPGAGVAPAEQQRRFVLIRMSFNDVLSQFDLFTEVITQRSEHDTGVWLSGLDTLAADALRLPRHDLEAPPIVCYLARGPGAAIRRVRTRLPGGGDNPVAIIRVPRERMVGHGIASSLVHEVGHQGAAMLDLVPSLRPVLSARARAAGPERGKAWRCFERWISEIVADLWSVSRLGIGATLGLMGVVSLPRWFVFRPSGDDPHPIPWVRVRLSAAMGERFYSHPQWSQLAATWEAMYPRSALPAPQRRTIDRFDATLAEFAGLLVDHRPARLGGATLGQALSMPDRRPEDLLATFADWRRDPQLLLAASPTHVFAAVGQARYAGQITPQAESRLLGELLRQWALRSTLDLSATCAQTSRRTSVRRAS
jgi:hypothetical protein